MVNTIIFDVKEGILNIKRKSGWMTRPDIIIKLLVNFISVYKIKELSETIIDLNDIHKITLGSRKLAIGTDYTNKEYIMPDPHSLMWPELNIYNMFEKCKIISEAGLIPPIYNRAFWIGQNCHPSRKALVEVSKQYPERIEARFLSCFLKDFVGHFQTLLEV